MAGCCTEEDISRTSHRPCCADTRTLDDPRPERILYRAGDTSI